MDSKKWSVQELATEIDRSDRTVRNYIIDGKLKALSRGNGRHGVPYQITNTELERFRRTALAPDVRERRGRKKKQA